MSDRRLEPIFVAANVREADFVERLLEDEGIEFTQGLEPVMRETSGIVRAEHGP